MAKIKHSPEYIAAVGRIVEAQIARKKVSRNVIAPDEGRAKRMARMEIEDRGGWVTRIIAVRFVGFVGTSAEWTVEMVTE
jgi:hypothetical protein